VGVLERGLDQQADRLSSPLPHLRINSFSEQAKTSLSDPGSDPEEKKLKKFNFLSLSTKNVKPVKEICVLLGAI
jgi:hypothetical protein